MDFESDGDCSAAPNFGGSSNNLPKRPQEAAVFSEGELDAIIKDPSRANGPLVSRILGYLDPQALEDKILQKGQNIYWYKTENQSVVLDVRALKTSFPKDYLKFRKNPKTWIYLFYFQWWNCYNEFCNLTFKDTGATVNKLSKIKRSNLGEYVSITGIVRRISETYAAITSTTHVCKACNNTVVKDRLWYQKIKPVSCRCNSYKDSLVEVESKRMYQSWQSITVQEDFSKDLVDLNVPSTELLDVRLTECRWFNNFIPGESVNLRGILRTEVLDKAKSRIYLDVLCAYHADSKKRRALGKKKLEAFQTVLDQKNPWNYLKSVIFKKLYGLQRLKDSGLLQLFGGGTSTRRQQIHVLCVGNPGTGKSETLRILHKMFGGIYVTGMGATSAGLTATVYKDVDNQWQLDGGALICANHSTLYLDEVDKMTPSAANSLLECMEQQLVSISKAGLNMNLPAKTKVFAVCNPKHKCSFDLTRPPIDQISLSTPLLSRFDAIIVVRDDFAQLDQQSVSKVILDKGNDPALEALIEEYIMYAKGLKVHVPAQIASKISEFYSKLVKLKIENLIVGPRQLESIYRLCEARCKSRLGTSVNFQDFKFVEEFLSEMYSTLAGCDVFLQTRTNYAAELLSSRLTKREQEYAAAVLQRVQIRVSKKDLFVELSKKYVNMNLKQFNSCVIKLQRDGLIYSPDGLYWVAVKPLKL